MPIIKKSVFNKTTILANEFLQNENITLEAKGLLGYLLSLPNNWDFTIAGISKKTNTSEYKITKILQELEANGYHTKKHIYENGRIKDWIYYIFAEPRQDIIDKTFDITTFEQDAENQDVENQECCFSMDKQTISNKLDIDIEKKKKDINMAKPKTPFSKLENLEETKKPKKRNLTKSQKNAIRCNQILENFLQYEPPAIQEALKLYVEVRKSKGLQPGQLQIILEEFKKEYNGKPQAIVLEQIRKATAKGWLMLVYKDTFTGSAKVSYGTKPSFDNTINHNIPKGVASMTKEEREYYEEHELARDENGNLIKF